MTERADRTGTRIRIARDRIERFVGRFGEPYRRLSWHAALPLILTPELLSYLRVHFLRGRGGVPWIGEADLLLSDLCRPVGHEQYALDQNVRACLQADMRARLGDDPLRETARLLLRYVRQLGTTGAGLGPAELQAEQWSAMAYLAEHRSEAARQIAAAFAAGLGTAAPVLTSEAISAAELARLVRVTDALAEQLVQHRELLDYAGEVARLLQDPAAMRAVGTRSHVEPICRWQAPGYGRSVPALCRGDRVSDRGGAGGRGFGLDQGESSPGRLG
jgi:hypothetical protein